MSEDKVLFDELEEEEIQVETPDIVEGLQAERDPASKMPDPFAIAKAEPIDVMSVDKIISAGIKKTREALLSEPRENIIIQVDPLNKTDDHVDTCINGYVIYIQRGKKVSCPKTLVDLLISSGYPVSLAR